MMCLCSACTCDQRCADSWSYNDIREARITTYSITDYNKAFYGTLNAIYDAPSSSFAFRIDGVRVCQDAWLGYHGYSRYMFYKLRKHIIEDTDPMWEHGNSFREYTSLGADLIQCWLTKIVEVLGDTDPACHKVYLPPMVSIVDCYDAFVHDLLHSAHPSDSIPSQWHFRGIWRTEFPYLKTVRKNRLGICDVCSDLEERVRNSKSRKVKISLNKMKTSHVSSVMDERRECVARDVASLSEPDRFMHITLDGKTPPKIPHFARLPKSILSAQRPKYEVFGLINWGLKDFLYFGHFDWWKHDANLVISILWFVALATDFLVFLLILFLGCIFVLCWSITNLRIHYI